MTREPHPQTSNARLTNRQSSTGAGSACRPPSSADPGRPSTDRAPRAVPDGGTMWVDLTGFQRDLVRCIQSIDDETTIPTGRTIKEEVESMYGEDVNHGRLYQNLNALVERGCIDKKVVDGRTNAYYLTDDATEMLTEAAREFVATCDIGMTATES